MLVLSLFPGIDLLGRGFEAAGFCVVRGPDLLWGGDVRGFCPPAGRFDGVIGGPPCQDFSRKRREPATGYGVEMLAEFVRVVEAAAPAWWLMENVPGVPDVRIEGYSWQRLDIRASSFGLKQRRLRHFQFGDRAGRVLVLDRAPVVAATEACALASEGRLQGRRGWAEFCALQGLAEPLDLPGMTRAARYRAVGNGVPLPVATALGEAVRDLQPAGSVRVCGCGCGRPVSGRATYARASCRKRMQRRREQG